MSSPLIEGKNLEKTYPDGTKALRGVSLTINKGEFVAIMGPSGSGKSTLLHILGLLDFSTGGKYLLNGKNIDLYSKDEKAHMRNELMGFVFQIFNLLPRTSALENVKLPLLYSNTRESLWDEKAAKTLESVSLSHRLSHHPAALSGGERQRVAIARALVTRPQVIFADEPTGNLDSKSGAHIIEILRKLNDDGNTIVLITHEREIAEHAKRVVYLRDGVIENDKEINNRKSARK